jgi:hypothetical protein
VRLFSKALLVIICGNLGETQTDRLLNMCGHVHKNLTIRMQYIGGVGQDEIG